MKKKKTAVIGLVGCAGSASTGGKKPEPTFGSFI